MQTIKLKYLSPLIEQISLDREISLILESPTPNEEPTDWVRNVEPFRTDPLQDFKA
ncbi:MAG: hypothetical protein RBT57_08800 [Paludibacter sp.]|jgi:hypothetical protein|nr:hypothetical protein [Paludibacter sp.]